MSIKKILKEYDNFDWINDINPISPHIENIVGKKLRHRDNNLAHIANHNDLSKIKDGGVLLLKPKMDYYFVVDPWSFFNALLWFLVEFVLFVSCCWDRFVLARQWCLCDIAGCA